MEVLIHGSKWFCTSALETSKHLNCLRNRPGVRSGEMVDFDTHRGQGSLVKDAGTQLGSEPINDYIERGSGRVEPC
jgi:hypothetical protein